MDAGNYTVTAIYLGNSYYAGSNNTTTVEVRRKDSILIVLTENITYSNTEREELSFYSSESATVTFTVTDPGFSKNYEITVNPTRAFNRTLEQLNAGIYNVTAVLPETTNVKGYRATNTFVVYQVDTSLTVKVTNITYVNVESVIVDITVLVQREMLM